MENNEIKTLPFDDMDKDNEPKKDFESKEGGSKKTTYGEKPPFNFKSWNDFFKNL